MVQILPLKIALQYWFTKHGQGCVHGKDFEQKNRTEGRVAEMEKRNVELVIEVREVECYMDVITFEHVKHVA